MNNKQLYESIMRSVSIEVKKVLNELSSVRRGNIKFYVTIEDDIEYIEDVCLHAEYELAAGCSQTKYCPAEDPELELDNIGFDESDYTPAERKAIRKYINDANNYEYLCDCAYEEINNCYNDED